MNIPLRSLGICFSHQSGLYISLIVQYLYNIVNMYLQNIDKVVVLR